MSKSKPKDEVDFERVAMLVNIYTGIVAAGRPKLNPLAAAAYDELEAMADDLREDRPPLAPGQMSGMPPAEPLRNKVQPVQDEVEEDDEPVVTGRR